jgi:hypothetical protein
MYINVMFLAHLNFQVAGRKRYYDPQQMLSAKNQHGCQKTLILFNSLMLVSEIALEKVKSKSLEKQVLKRLEICMSVAGVPRDVGLSTHCLRTGT